MSTPTEFLRDKLGNLINYTKEGMEQNGTAIRAAGEAVIGATPVGSIINTSRIAIPALIDGGRRLGTSIKGNPSVKGIVNDPVVQGVAGLNPATGLLSTAVSASQLIPPAGKGKGKGGNDKKPDAPAEPAKPYTSSDGGTVYSADGKTYTTGGVTYSRDGSGQAINPDTGEVSSGGYSIKPSTGARTDYKPGEDRGSGTGGSEVRESGGIVQKGITLGGINELFASLSSADRKGGAVMTAGDLGSGSKFLSEALPTTDGGDEQAAKPFTLSQVDLDEGYDSSDGAYPGKATAFTQTPSTPATTSNPDDVQDGASDKPTLADNIRTVRMARGARQQEFAERPGNSSSDEPKNSGTNWGARTPSDNSDERLKARAAFLDPGNKGYGAIRARDRAVGTFDQNGVGTINIDGKLYNFKDGMSREARFERAGGLSSKEDAQEFLNKYVQTVDAKPEASEIPTPTAAVTPEPEVPASEQTNTTIGTPGLPQTVPMSQIPGHNASQAEWDAYQKRLQGGELTGPATYAR